MATTTTKTVTEILNSYGARVEAELTDNLEFDGKLATGKLKDSIRFDVTILGKSYIFEIFMEDYWKWIDKGRKPTTKGGGVRGKKLDWAGPSLRKEILGWLTAKRIGHINLGKRQNSGTGLKGNASVGKKSAVSTGLQSQRSLAVLIARKIHRFGFKGSHFYTNTFKPGHAGDLEPLEKELSEALQRDVKVMIEEVKQEMKQG